MRIPEVAERLRQLSRNLGVPELAELAGHLHRRPPARTKTRAKSQMMTPYLAVAIRKTAVKYPHLSHQEIGGLYGVNTGRVSEAIGGKRT